MIHSSRTHGGLLLGAVFLIVTLCLTVFVPATVCMAAKGPAKTLSVKIHVVVNWEDEGEIWINKGSATYTIGGMLTMDSKGSPVVQTGGKGVMPIVTYKPQGLHGFYSYEEKIYQVKPSPPDCDPLYTEYGGSGGFQIQESAGLNIRRFGSIAAARISGLSADKKAFLKNMPGMAFMSDYYEFFIGGPGTKRIVNGNKRVGSKCRYEETEKKLPGFSLGLQCKLPQSASMTGVHVWSAETHGRLPPSFKIVVCDLPPPMGERPYVPEKMDAGKVSYNVSWNISEAEAYDIVMEPEKKKDPCKALENRINEIRLQLKRYQNKKVKQYCEKVFGEEDGSAYRQIVEKLKAYMDRQAFETYQDGVNFIDGLEPNDIAAIDYNTTVDPTAGVDTDVTDTIDEYSDRQQEALNEEMENLLNNFKDSGCADQ